MSVGVCFRLCFEFCWWFGWGLRDEYFRFVFAWVGEFISGVFDNFLGDEYFGLVLL